MWWMTSLSTISFLGFLICLYWTRAISQDRGFFHQLQVDFWRLYYSLQDRYLDRKLGIETSKQVPVVDLNLSHSIKMHARRYQATPYSVIQRVLSQLTRQPTSHYNFIDYGSGKGRVLMMATQLPFKSVIGIEADARLAKISEANLKRAASPANYEILNINAREMAFLPDAYIHFLFNPFDGHILSRLMDKIDDIAKVDPRQVIVTVNPIHQRLIENRGYRCVAKLDHIHEDFSCAILEAIPEAFTPHSKWTLVNDSPLPQAHSSEPFPSLESEDPNLPPARPTL